MVSLELVMSEVLLLGLEITASLSIAAWSSSSTPLDPNFLPILLLSVALEPIQ